MHKSNKIHGLDIAMWKNHNFEEVLIEYGIDVFVSRSISKPSFFRRVFSYIADITIGGNYTNDWLNQFFPLKYDMIITDEYGLDIDSFAPNTKKLVLNCLSDIPINHILTIKVVKDIQLFDILLLVEDIYDIDKDAVMNVIDRHKFCLHNGLTHTPILNESIKIFSECDTIECIEARKKGDETIRYTHLKNPYITFTI